MPEPTHFLQVTDHDAAFLSRVLDAGTALRDGGYEPLLGRRTLAMVFEKPSLRTRVSFEVAMTRLGGHAVNLQPAEIALGEREPAGDVARVLSGMADAVMARVFDHATLEQLAAASTVPVVNGLSDRRHPCQALADAMTLRDEFGPDLRGRRVAFVGDANNVMRSLAAICGRLGVAFTACCPDGYGLGDADLARLRRDVPELDFSAEPDPDRAVAGADAVYTDTWTSMGQEAEQVERRRAFAGYTVTPELMGRAASHAILMHCLPAHRGEEVAAEVIDDPRRSRVFPQAHNRLHAQAGLLCVLLGAA